MTTSYKKSSSLERLNLLRERRDLHCGRAMADIFNAYFTPVMADQLTLTDINLSGDSIRRYSVHGPGFYQTTIPYAGSVDRDVFLEHLDRVRREAFSSFVSHSVSRAHDLANAPDESDTDWPSL